MVILKSDLIYSTQTINHKKQIQIPTDHTFFGINVDYKIKLHSQIFDFVYYTKSGFTFSDIYNMPITLRKFYYDRLVKALTKEAESIRKNKNKK